MIYCVEDDDSIRELMLYALRASGFEAEGFWDSVGLFDALSHAQPQLIMLDIMLPGMDGIEILKALRGNPTTARIPVIIASARGTEYDKVVGLDLGADDYLAKPFGMMEMVSRIRAVLRRAAPAATPGLLQMGNLRMDSTSHTVYAGDTRVELTLKEFELLKLFLEHPGRVFTRDQLLERIWSTDYVGETRTVDVHIGTLRTKLGQCGEYIRTVRGVGYRMEAEALTKRVFRSIFLASLAVLLAAVVLILGALYTYFSDVQAEQLRLQTALVAHALETEGVSYFDDLDTSDRRITWIAADGTVLYDSRSDSGVMENHLEREEVKAALATGSGTSFRYSDTLMERYIYTAQRLSDGTVLRFSAAQNTVPHLVLGVVKPIILVIGIAVALSALLAGQLTKNIVAPLNELNLDDPMSNREYVEIQPLLRRLDSQQVQLRAQSQELRQKQKEFNTVTRSLSEGLVLMNSSGTVLSINPAATRLLEITPNCLGADFGVANRNAAISALVEKALTGEKAEENVALTGGEYLAAASPVRSDGAVFGVVLLLFDVTQKQKAEALRREFTANVSHELKTPLHAISGYAELMKDGLVPPEDTRHFAEKIYSEAQRMIDLVEDTLRLSRLDEGAADMQWAPIDLYETAKSAMQELTAPAELKNVSIQLEGTKTVIQGIPQLVSGIVFNLMDNAVKYNKDGGLVIVRLGQEKNQAVLTVTDTGIGISPEHQERVFERFYRVDKSHSKEIGGTGLGLSIVKHAALILGAAIELDSTVGKGTIVTVRFPMEKK